VIGPTRFRPIGTTNRCRFSNPSRRIFARLKAVIWNRLKTVGRALESAGILPWNVSDRLLLRQASLQENHGHIIL
jgi:hypothetical protein